MRSSTACWNKKKQRKGHKVRVADWDILWGSEQRQAFLKLKDVLASPDFLAPPRDGAERTLVTDARQYGLGVFLLQNDVERGWLPLGFASRKLKGAEVRWTVSEKECAAVIFGLETFRHLLYGDEFTVVADHKALAWLISLTDPKDRLARWMLEAQSFAFAVEYSPGGGEWMVVPDALSRDTFSKNIVYCGRCLEALCVLGDTSERVKAGLNEETVKKEQTDQYGNLEEYTEKHDDFVVGKDGLLYRVFAEIDIRLVVPSSLTSSVLDYTHGSKAVGHWIVRRTSARVRCRFRWPQRKRDVRVAVQSCRACYLAKQTLTRRQAKMVQWHPPTRFILWLLTSWRSLLRVGTGTARSLSLETFSRGLWLRFPSKKNLLLRLQIHCLTGGFLYLDLLSVCSATKASLVCLRW
jgi:RNase H-like domain found in reverse transcriptase/Integrase zinc binding domain